MKHPKVYIIILNYNSWSDTIECLESVLKNDYPDYQILLVDNNSTDNSLDCLKKWLNGHFNLQVNQNNPLKDLSNPPAVKPISYIYYLKEVAERGGDLELESKNNYQIIIIQTECNLGYAGGNNVGIRYALAKNDFEYIWILNNDTVINSETLSNIVNSAIDDEYDRPIGSYVYEYRDPEKLQMYGGLRFYKYFVLRPFFAKLKEDIDFISGVSLFLSKKKIKELGLIEEKYFLNFEDLDYTYFYKEAFSNKYTDVTPFLIAGKIWHKHSVSQSKDKFLHSYYFTRSTLYTSRKINRINYFLTFTYAIFRGIFYFLLGYRDNSKGIFLGIKDFMNKRTGRLT
ncbi:MAG: Glycosyl transferase family 2 [Candidatus Magasanikbacteria bacterium GW2011_GWC2_37_14]|uniref:Glycosyl transferase family 2 n=1 Tax=Candidatus Magasanikbacteria bacterium GW2011_GWC2_37_14 TaxID=1619046 RepID=A0A0G0G6Y6_9BACT|nr:MAG: Glycosyl transferase family 2 [Candidatus Magasanikbacteria bacterium GW2011_GWC2_37_14]